MRPRIVALCFALVSLGTATATFAQPGTWADKLFEKLEQDFGVVAKNSEAKYRLKLKNPHPDPVHIRQVRTKCTCAQVKASTDTLAPGEEGYIEIVFDTAKYERHKDTTMIVEFDRPQFSEVHIPIKAYINPDVILTPGAINFEVVNKGEAVTRTIDIRYTSRQGTAITSLFNSKKNAKLLNAQLQEIGRNGPLINYELTVTLSPDAPEGDLREQMALITNDPMTPQIAILVEGHVEAPFRVTNKLVDFGTYPPGHRRSVNLVITGKEEFDIEKIESDHTEGVFEVRLPKSPRKTHVLEMTMIFPDEPGVLKEEFTVTIKGRKETLSFKAQGRVQPTTSQR